MSHLAYSGGQSGDAWVRLGWRSMGRSTPEDPSPCGGPSPTSPCGDATLRLPGWSSEAGGWVGRTAKPRVLAPAGRPLRSRAAARRPPAGAQHAAAAGSLLSSRPPEGPTSHQRVQVRSLPPRQNPSRDTGRTEHGHVHRQRHGQSEDEDEDDGEKSSTGLGQTCGGRGHG